MFRCLECGMKFDYPDYMEVCLEDYYGVGSMFPNRNYGVIAQCPYCGDEDIEEFDEDDEDIFEVTYEDE